MRRVPVRRWWPALGAVFCVAWIAAALLVQWLVFDPDGVIAGERWSGLPLVGVRSMLLARLVAPLHAP